MHLLQKECVKVVVLLRGYFAEVASKLVPVGHPWGEIFSLFGKIDITQLANVLIQSWACLNNVYKTNLGLYNQERVSCYIQYLRRSIDPVDAERPLRNLLADCDRVWGITAITSMTVVYYLADNLRRQREYVDAERLAFDLLTRVKASPMRDVMEGGALELMARTQYVQEKNALAEKNMQSSILHEDRISGMAGSTASIRRRIALESWLRDWNRESDADVVRKRRSTN